ncbi:MAG: hypothetical protein QXD33_00360 [Nitrososphaerota archaeon]
MYCLAVCKPHRCLGGGERRTFEVLKYFSEFDVTPILYIPYSDILSTIILEEVYKLEKLTHVLKTLEHFNVIIPEEIYDNIENISLNIQHHLDHLKKRGMYAALSNFNKSIQTIRRLFKDDISFVKEFLINSVNMNRINPNKPGFVYSMDGVPSFVVTGAFFSNIS